MLLPKYTFEDLSVGSGSIIGKENIEDFFNHVSKHKNLDDKSIAELAPNYEMASTSLVHMLEARFVILHPIIQEIIVIFMMLKMLKRKILL